MREIVAKKITSAIKTLFLEANTNLPEEVLDALNKALAKERSSNARDILRQLIQNDSIAWRDKMPLCQDTGFAIVFAQIGQDVHIDLGNFNDAVNEGVRQAYQDGYFRKSIVSDPIERVNTCDNTPAIIHTEIVPGETIKLSILAKGGGAENCSAIKMFKPTSTLEEIDEFIIETIIKAQANPCPPIIVGIGIGGTFDYAPILAKKALMRKLGQHHSAKDIAKWEKELLEKINQTGIGPMGLGGTTTALGVNIERYACHISSLPVAVNIDCHSHRFKEIII